MYNPSGYGQVKSEGQNVAARQQAINSVYEMLLKSAEERRRRLDDSIKMFSLSRECEEVEMWIREKEVVMKGEEKGSTKEQLQAMQKKYDVIKRERLINILMIIIIIIRVL